MSKYATLADRIIANSVLDPEGSDCWIWIGARLKSGYGRINVMTPVGEVFATLAHRESWRAFRAQECYQLDVHHRCGNRACVNPGHLEIMTHRENCKTGRRKNGTNGARRNKNGEFSRDGGESNA